MRSYKSQIPLRYLVADRFAAGGEPVADLLARAFAASKPNDIAKFQLVCDQLRTCFEPVCDQIA